jgi:hypothetical protein
VGLIGLPLHERIRFFRSASTGLRGQLLLIFNAVRRLSRFGDFRGHCAPSEARQHKTLLQKTFKMTNTVAAKASILGRNTI